MITVTGAAMVLSTLPGARTGLRRALAAGVVRKTNLAGEPLALVGPRGANSCAIAQQNAEAASNGQHAGKRNCDRSPRHALRSRKGDGLPGKVIGRSHEENQRKEKSSQNDHCTLEKTLGLHTVGNCHRISCHVVPPDARSMT